MVVVLSNFSEIREEQFWFEISLRVFIWPSKLLMFCRGKKLVFLMFYFLCLYVLTFLFFYVHMFLVLMFLFLMLLFLIFLCISYVVCFSCMTFLILLLIQGGSLIFVITNNSFARYKITYYYLKWCCWKLRLAYLGLHCLVLYSTQNYLLSIWLSLLMMPYISSERRRIKNIKLNLAKLILWWHFGYNKECTSGLITKLICEVNKRSMQVEELSFEYQLVHLVLKSPIKIVKMGLERDTVSKMC